MITDDDDDDDNYELMMIIFTTKQHVNKFRTCFCHSLHKINPSLLCFQQTSTYKDRHRTLSTSIPDTCAMALNRL